MYARGKFGIEYTPPKPDPEGSGLGRVMLVAAIASAILVGRAVWVRVFSRSPSDTTVAIATTVDGPAAAEPSAPVAKAEESARPATAFREVDYADRPVKVRNLLLRLNEAERRNDLEMAVSTIEQLRATPGAADLDDTLARRLGTLNFRRLFDRKSAQWTTSVKVKRGDSATRIAFEHGSTLASLVKLNDGGVDKLKIGQSLTVMNHPRFNLVISRRTRTADLMLNGKFFKRYYLTDEVKGEEGSYETPERFRSFCTEQGVPFKPLDRAELEMLLPKGAAAYIREI